MRPDSVSLDFVRLELAWSNVKGLPLMELYLVRQDFVGSEFVGSDFVG